MVISSRAILVPHLGKNELEPIAVKSNIIGAAGRRAGGRRKTKTLRRGVH
jgi:hypothetical protein